MMRSRLRQLIAKSEERWYSRYQQPLAVDLSLAEALSRFPDRNSLHAYMHHYFHHFCPLAVQRHREFFRGGRRGFGENAFHALWWLLFKQYKPVNCVEIGVYRGQVISLWALMGRLLGYSPDVVGISPFSAAGDEVSIYDSKIDYYADTLESFRHFELSAPTLVRGYSTGSEAHAAMSSRLWDLIYIDGSHEYDVVLSDYRLSAQQLRPGGLLVMDDASAETSYRPPRFSLPDTLAHRG